ncbi:MAG: ATP-binding protein, partial [Bacteroidales bacterium]|nr:ATP-binding protein [Bacteroidales bacterium]
MLYREIQKQIKQQMFQGKAFIIVGARQVGKSTLMHQIMDDCNVPNSYLNCDQPETQTMLSDASTTNLQRLVGNNKLLIIDEAQQIPNIGMTLKRIIDNNPDVQLIVTGSSSLDLKDKLNEPLTGRKYEYKMFPLSTKEIFADKGLAKLNETLEQRLIFGSYPYIVEHPENAENEILELCSSYLYKDLLSMEGIRRPVLLDKLIKALAYQIGNLVSYNEIAQLIGADSKTVEKYIDLLEKCFVVFRLEGLSRNSRNELKKAKKIYFYDNGIRNAVIQNFAPLALRADKGALWENFFISER